VLGKIVLVLTRRMTDGEGLSADAPASSDVAGHVLPKDRSVLRDPSFDLNMTVSSVDKCDRAAKCVIVRKSGSPGCPYPRPCSDGRERAVPILEGDNESRDPRGAHGAPCSRWQNATPSVIGTSGKASRSC
jgi:hypothetical protein